MLKCFTLIEKVLIVIGFCFGSFCSYEIIGSLQGASPSIINEILMTLFGGFLGGGAFYIIGAALFLIFKLTVHCKNLMHASPEE